MLLFGGGDLAVYGCDHVVVNGAWIPRPTQWWVLCTAVFEVGRIG
ncbi:hypothetical protein [Streptosporangium fragile]